MPSCTLDLELISSKMEETHLLGFVRLVKRNAIFSPGVAQTHLKKGIEKFQSHSSLQIVLIVKYQ